MTNKIHYDAAGHVVYDILTLRKMVRDENSSSLLKKFLLCHVIVIPYVSIRIYKKDPTQIDVIKYGCGRDETRNFVLQNKQIEALRRLYSQKGRGAWRVHATELHVIFSRDAKIIRDPLRRYGCR